MHNRERLPVRVPLRLRHPFCQPKAFLALYLNVQRESVTLNVSGATPIAAPLGGPVAQDAFTVQDLRQLALTDRAFCPAHLSHSSAPLGGIAAS